MGQGKDSNIELWLDRVAPKRAKPAPTEVELGELPPQGIKHHLLGPKLRAKFPRFSQGSSTTTEHTGGNTATIPTTAHTADNSSTTEPQASRPHNSPAYEVTSDTATSSNTGIWQA